MLSKLVESIQNVESNIRFYKEAKKQCEKCNIKFSENNCYNKKHCIWYIDPIIHLDVMERKRDELLEEYNQKYKGTMRGDGSIIGENND